MELNSQNSVVFVDTCTFIEICTLDIEFEYLKDCKLVNLAFSPALFLEYIGFSGQYRDQFMKRYDAKIGMPRGFTPGNFYLQRFEQYGDVLFDDRNSLVQELNEKIRSKNEKLKNKKSEIIKKYHNAFELIANSPHFMEAIISFLSLTRSLTLYKINFHNDDDALVWLNNIINFSVEIAKLQNCKINLI